jgi:hypothetical protein
MIKFTVGTEIARSPTDVFAYVTDPTKLASLVEVSEYEPDLTLMRQLATYCITLKRVLENTEPTA